MDNNFQGLLFYLSGQLLFKDCSFTDGTEFPGTGQVPNARREESAFVLSVELNSQGQGNAPNAGGKGTSVDRLFLPNFWGQGRPLTLGGRDYRTQLSSYCKQVYSGRQIL